MKKFIMRLCLRYAAPCGVTDEKLNLYANQPLRDLLGIPRCVDSKEPLATKPSQAMTVFQTQEKQARDQQLLLSILMA